MRQEAQLLLEESSEDGVKEHPGWEVTREWKFG
jgi:hypothetical protein